jgi:hypothetical protein
MVTLWAMIVAHPKQKWLKIVEKNVFGDFCLNNLQASSYKILPTRLFYGPLNGVHLSYDIPMVLFTIMTQYSYPMGHDDYSSMAKNRRKISFWQYSPDFFGDAGYGQNKLKYDTA